ncbi:MULTISPECIES: class D sortase [Clostridium]|uniref:Sortase family protein n=1 Tax=Clostridium novyi (strain NT) TaxID=386415 RepID=A0Q262_CLONN|nr:MULTISPECIES: class D sortase [Clostridium]ABK62339.1 sortase family protein [Clostridium novyi NT]KEH86232.1 hypothetical protein Z966_03570 [Clostridium novyi A str. NCTC 538]KEH88507.1 hypothetical protein Z967_01825 [Clostridium novyi A str. 4540]KEH89115.1 hypothetical protein Z965_03745 [Clostridium novyi A str. BKT29909]KEH93259.1 hypothetical protein Z963_02670 [Clostridium botulinum C/D str. It1]
MIKKRISIVIIFIGILIFIYPKISELYYTNKQKRIIRKYDNLIENKFNTKTKQQIENKDILNNKKLNNVDGILKIDKISLKLPILHGCNQKNLKVSLSSLDNNVNPGQVGNYVVAGHRSKTYGRNFNRLNEVNKDDIIEVDTLTNKYKYVIQKKIVVRPEETWILNSNGKDREITLITCYPINKPTHRLILKGVSVN